MIRRDFVRLGGAGVAGLVAEAALPKVLRAAADWRTLKVTAVETYRLQTNSLFVLVRTNEGITGLGEVSPMNTRVLEAVVRHSLAPLVVGKNPLDVGRIWDEMLHATYKLGTAGSQPEAMAGIDIALWDILGKTAGLPIHALLGGKRKDKIRLYASIGNGAQNPIPDQVKKAVAAVVQGYSAVKMRMEWSSRATDVNPFKDWELLIACARRSATRSTSTSTPTTASRSRPRSDSAGASRTSSTCSITRSRSRSTTTRATRRSAPRSTWPSPRASTSTRSGSSAT
jgi:hypothetical protein